MAVSSLDTRDKTDIVRILLGSNETRRFKLEGAFSAGRSAVLSGSGGNIWSLLIPAPYFPTRLVKKRELLFIVEMRGGVKGRIGNSQRFGGCLYAIIEG